MATVFVNEIHYDNSGTDANEAIEIVAPLGTDLTGWSIVLYNFTNGASYDTKSLTGLTLVDIGSGFGALVVNYAVNGIQNGPNDGIALVNGTGQVVQFLSYEGVITATNGPAVGLTSSDIGVSEDGAGPATFSLQLTGTGADSADFTWTAASVATFGAANTGQNFASSTGPGALRVADVSVIEGNSGSSPVTITVNRSGGTVGAVTVDYAVSFAAPASGNADAADLVAGQTLTGTLAFAAGATSASFTFNVAGDTTAEPDENFTVTLSNPSGGATIADATGNVRISNDDVLAGVSIGSIQGAAHTSPFNGQVVTVAGIVTARDSNGFYLQDAGDGNALTSDAVFVFTSSAPTVAVGDSVSVRGTVSEFAGTGDLGTTQIGATPMVTILSSGNALPAATLIGPDGLRPPTELIEDDNFATFNPAVSGSDFFESLEGMLVTLQSPIVTSPTVSGELFAVVSRNGADPVATGLSERFTTAISGGEGALGTTNQGAGSDFNPERIKIFTDTGIVPGASTPAVATGTILNNITGVVTYFSQGYEVKPTVAITVATPSPLSDNDTTALRSGTGSITIADYNVENLDPNDSDGDTDVADGKFVNIGRDIGLSLGAPDIVALQEIQDNSGSANDGTVSASLTLQRLSDEIFAATGGATGGGIRYSVLDNPFVSNNNVGGQPGGNIRVAYLYRADRGVTLDAASVTTITPADNPFSGARQPLVATFQKDGESITLINNHFTSKGGSTDVGGAVQPSVNAGEDRRARQADAVNDYVDTLLAANPNIKLAVVGDLNDFQFEEPLQVLTGALTYNGGIVTGGGTEILANLALLLPANERYSFLFDGNAQILDHILVSGALQPNAQYDIVHINNTVLPSQANSDHDPNVALLQLSTGGGTPQTNFVTGTNPGGETLIGSAGVDFIVALGGNDTLNALGGNDRLYGAAGNDTLAPGAGNDIVYGEGGEDAVDYKLATGAVFVDIDASFALESALTTGTFGAATAIVSTDVLYTIENVAGSAFGDRIYGGTGATAVAAGAGNDIVYGGGAAAANTLYYDQAAGALFADLAINTVAETALTSGTVSAGTAVVSRDQIYEFANLTASAFGDRLYGSAAANSLNGLAGNDIIYGEAGGDLILGGDGDDFLVGGDGSDALYGQSGFDILIGGAGGDFFFFNELNAASEDRVTDFEVGIDNIFVAGVVFGYAPGAGVTLVSGSAPVASAANSFLYDTGTGLISFDADGAGGAAAIAVVTLQAGLALTQGDFVVYG